MSPLTSALRRGTAVLAVVSSLAALPMANAAARPVDPVAHTAVAPLAISVASFIGKELAVGVLNKIGGEAFGAALSELGFANPDSARLKKVDEALARIEVSMQSLHSKIDHIAGSLAFARLSAVRHSVSSISGYVADARTRLMQLTNGTIQTASVRASKRQELLELIRTKILHEQNILMTAIYSPQGNDDILHMAYLAERSNSRRFWTDENSRRALAIVSYYQSLAAEVLYFRIEYEYSSITASSTPEEIADRKTLVKQMVDDYYAKFPPQSVSPTLFGTSGTSGLMVDTKPFEGRNLVWDPNANYTGHIASRNTVSEAGHLLPLPSVAEFRHLVDGRGSMSPTEYLRSEGWDVDFTCRRDYVHDDIPVWDRRATETAQWTRDKPNGLRWVWAPWDNGAGGLPYGCDFMRVRHLYPWERPWPGAQ